MTDLKTVSTTATKPTKKEIISEECRDSEEKDLQSIRRETKPDSFFRGFGELSLFNLHYRIKQNVRNGNATINQVILGYVRVASADLQVNS